MRSTREQAARAMQRQHRRRKALADAVAGVVASLVALWTFYPIDVIKTNIQAGKGSFASSSTIICSTELFRGLQMKTLSTASSGFTFFYFYSWIVSWWKAGRSKDANLSTVSRLALSAVAAMCNVCITFPLDVIGTQQQTGGGSNNKSSRRRRISTSPTTTPEEPVSAESLLEQAWHAANDDREEEEVFFDSVSDGSDPEFIKFEPPARSFDDENQEDIDSDHEISPCDRHLHIKKISSHWKGLYPAILLCTNPSIHYTVFDVLKSHWLSTTSKDKLSMRQAFLCGLMAKFTATVCTYPLIRAKIMLMTTSSSSDSLFGCLIREYRQGGGIKSWYRGIDLQLIHTILKSALLMMVREAITNTTYRLILPRTAVGNDVN